MKKGQVIEYLSSYGYAFMIMFFILGAIIYFDILNPADFLPDKCVLDNNVPCQGHNVVKIADGNAVLFYMKNEYGFDMINVSFNASLEGEPASTVPCEYFDEASYVSDVITVPAGGAMEFYCPGICGVSATCKTDIAEGDKNRYSLYGTFIPEDGRFRRSIQGYIRGSLPKGAGDYVPPAPDVMPPVVSIVSPTSGTFSGVITVDISATDNTGVNRVYLDVDGTERGVDSGYPYIISLNTALLVDGTHTLTARAVDYSGNEDTSLPVDIDTTNIACVDNAGLVSWYGFESSGDLGFDSFGANHGTPQGSPTQDTGVIGSSLRLSGSGQAIRVPDTSLLDLTNRFTLITWVNHDSTAYKTWEAILAKGDNSYRIHLCGSASLCGALGRFSLGSNGLSDTEAGSGMMPTNGIWQHIAVVYNGSHKQFYVDGSQQGVEPATGSLVNSAYGLGIGENTQQAGRNWDGMLDEVSVWSRNLSQAEVQQLYALIPYCS